MYCTKNSGTYFLHCSYLFVYSSARQVRTLFQDSPYHFPDRSQVNIMDGPDEGLFAWITVNFLLGQLACSVGQFCIKTHM